MKRENGCGPILLSAKIDGAWHCSFWRMNECRKLFASTPRFPLRMFWRMPSRRRIKGDFELFWAISSILLAQYKPILSLSCSTYCQSPLTIFRFGWSRKYGETSFHTLLTHASDVSVRTNTTKFRFWRCSSPRVVAILKIRCLHHVQYSARMCSSTDPRLTAQPAFDWWGEKYQDGILAAKLWRNLFRPIELLGSRTIIRTPSSLTHWSYI